eukprot:CAMPEP_0197009382 /NCGR_PEP_ID=MMETSP1380-20130617/49875_1 /TAXON_ID=5936 /ORGANISM="Euplotes crassus, Strain CT5" /LENGTH=379 /DNA_ID=CAMNT_0042430601 /DNA_START=108 /DNA_END=1247 /DNA_ORIENTATION=+
MDKNPEHEEAMDQLVQNEVDVMKTISHPNVVNLLNYSMSENLIKPNGDSKEVYYLALELATGGELFDFLAETGPFSEELTRYYFKQLITTFAYLNENGVSHRDLKPENIMFDQDYNLKIADFGLSSDKALNFSKKGTLNYMAPEVLEGCAYNGHCVDLFAIGIITFLIYSKHPPFLKAANNDQYYRLLIGNRQDLFWAFHSKSKEEGYYSESLRDLLQWLFAFNPMERPSISEIMSHEWFNGPVPTHDEVKEIIELKKAAVLKENYQPDSEVPFSGSDPSTVGSTTWRSFGADENSTRKAAIYVPELKRFTQFFSTSEADILLGTFVLFAEKNGNEVKIDNDQYSATMKIAKEEEDEDPEMEMEIRVNVLQVDEKAPKY